MNITLTSEAVDRQEALRYLGYQGQPFNEEIKFLLEECIALCVQTATPRYVHQSFPSAQESSGALHLNGTTLTLTGRDIVTHMQGADSIVILAVTLGIAIDQKIDLAKRQDMTRAVILDAVASAAVESVCNAAESEIKNKTNLCYPYTNFRYSPGYGDFPLSLQPQLIAAVNAERAIGLTCSPSLIMLPRKSVTAVFGLFKEKPSSVLRAEDACLRCQAYENCTLRKAGSPCGHPKTNS